MTTEIERLRTLEETTDIAVEGGSTPKKEYENRSGINDGARSAGRLTELTSSSSLPGTNTSCESEREGRYGQIQITETRGGHKIIFNDTLGSESIMIRHCSGSGVEMRPDGSILISGTQIHYNVRGNANFIIEGNTEFRSDGNINFNAGGGINLNASGEISMKTPGSMVQDVGADLVTAVGGHLNQNVKGSSTNTIMGERNDVNLGGFSQNTKGDMTIRVDGDGGIYSSGNMNMTSQGRSMISSPSVSITGSKLEVVGASGTMGGEGIISYSLNSYVGESLSAGKTVSTQSLFATRTVKSDTVWCNYVDTVTVNAEKNVDTHTLNSTVLDTDTVLSSHIDADAMYAETFHGNLEGVAKYSDAPGAYTGPTTNEAEAKETGVDPVYQVVPDQRRTFAPSHQIIQDRQRGLYNGIRRIRVDPGDYIRNHMDRTVATGGNPNETVDRTPKLPDNNGTVARPSGSPVKRQMSTSTTPRVPSAPHTPTPGTASHSIEDLKTRDPEAAQSATEFINSIRTVEGVGADATWIPFSDAGKLYMITADFLRKEDGSYWRASTGEAQQIANKFGAEIPSPSQIDAMWTMGKKQGAQGHRVDTADLAKHYDYSPPLDNNAANRDELIRQHNEHPHIAGQIQGSETLRVGHFKSIAKQGGTLGIYGWRNYDGTVVQPFYSGHSSDYYDYSQALRLIKEIK